MRKTLTHKTESVPPVFKVEQCIDTKTGATTRVCNKHEAQVMQTRVLTLPPITSSLNANTHTFQQANHRPPAQSFVSDGFSYFFE